MGEGPDVSFGDSPSLMCSKARDWNEVDLRSGLACGSPSGAVLGVGGFPGPAMTLLQQILGGKESEGEKEERAREVKGNS